MEKRKVANSNKSIKYLAQEFFQRINEGSQKLIFNRNGLSEFERNLLFFPDLYFEVNNEWSEVFQALKNSYAINCDSRTASKLESMLIFIAKGTIAYYRSKKSIEIYKPQDKTFVTIERASLDNLVYKTKVINEFNDFMISDYKKLCSETLTYVKDEDCIELCKNILEQGIYSKVALLSMKPDANLVFAVDDIDKRSNYLMAQFMNKAIVYPLPEYSVLYSPGVFIFRDTEERAYRILKQPFLLEIINITMPNLRKKENSELLNSDKNLKIELTRKLKVAFQFAIKNKIEALVLGMIGKKRILFFFNQVLQGLL